MINNNTDYSNQIRRMVSESSVQWEKLRNNSVLVTGAAGMLGSGIVDVLIFLNEEKDFEITIYALGRTKEKIEKRYEQYLEKDYFNVIGADVTEKLSFDMELDYIIHAASNANPYMYANYPVDTLLANVMGTDNFLRYAKDHNTKRVLYVSSGEMYGQPEDGLENGFDEGFCGKVDYSDSRSCYPAGKRAAEALCQSYLSQYGVDVAIVRPCHCYGPTQTESDNRAISQFIQKALAGEDIVLKSDGSLERTHCYIVDAVQAMLMVLLNAPAGEAYNIADNESDASVRILAETIASGAGVKVLFDIPDSTEKKGFSKVTRAVLDGRKLRELGWMPMWHLNEGIESTLNIMIKEK